MKNGRLTSSARVGHGSGPSMGRVGSQNCPFWVGRVGSAGVWVSHDKRWSVTFHRSQFLMCLILLCCCVL